MGIAPTPTAVQANQTTLAADYRDVWLFLDAAAVELAANMDDQQPGSYQSQGMVQVKFLVVGS